MSSDDLNYWNVAQKCVAAVWDAHARIYHGYEVIGMEHVPVSGAALIVYYHGAIPIDMYYFVARVCLERVSKIYSITLGDHKSSQGPFSLIRTHLLQTIPGPFDTHRCRSIPVQVSGLGHHFGGHESMPRHGTNLCQHAERR